MDRSNFIKSLLLVTAGFVLAYLVFTLIDRGSGDGRDTSSDRLTGFSVNPFSTESDDHTDLQRIELLESSVAQLKQHLLQLWKE